MTARDPRKEPKAGDVVLLTEFGPATEYRVTGRTVAGVRYENHGIGSWMTLRGWANLMLCAEVIHVAE